jgi:3-oxoacyl-[acyl-carrier protein] reductase
VEGGEVEGLSGKRALVTGGTAGIGRATAKRLLKEGCRVFVCGIDGDELGETLDELNGIGPVAGCVTDVSVEEQVEDLMTEAIAFLGGIDVLVNNAGIGPEVDFLQITPEQFDAMIAVNLRGSFLVAQAVAKRMVAVGTRGSIVSTASTNAFHGVEGNAPYNASKAGVVQLTRTMAAELGRYGIRVNAVCPGYIDTAMNADHPSSFRDRFVRTFVPMGRMGQPDEIAAAFAFLASDDASFVHGSMLVVDGGELASQIYPVEEEEG